VVGASDDPAKYGHIAYTMLKQYGKTVWPVNPNAATVDGDSAFPNVAALPETPDVVVVVVPPPVTERVVEELGAAGVRNVWMQPGAESARAVERAKELGLSVVSGGPCVLVNLRTHLSRT
jgi:predicted CoA-binding protein